MKKLLLLIILTFSISAFAQHSPVDKARGFFITVGVGPRLPLGEFNTTTDLGTGFDIEFSYTDDQYIPFFLFGRVGFDQYPGAQSFYQISDYSNYSTNALPVNLGIRYFFPPLLENVVLFMPVVEISANYTYYQKIHQFKLGTGRTNFTEDISKIGFTGGVGLSMFMMEVVVSYNYFQTNQYFAADLRVRLPLYINL